MPIFENKALTAALIVSAALSAPYYFALASDRLKITAPRHVGIFFAVWLLLFTFEFYILGPYSFIEMSHEGNFNVALNYYLSHQYNGGRFSHQFSGGQDVYSMLPGKQYFNPELLLAYIFPTWIVVAAHKIFLAALGFAGSYLLARKAAPDNRAIAVAVAAIFPVSHEYLLNFSTNWGTGFAALPLAVYACVVCSKDRFFWRWIFLATLVLAAGEPIHTFPPLALAVIGGALLFKDVDLKKVVIGFSIFAFFSLLVWHEFLFANYLGAADTGRGVKTSDNFLEAILSGVDILLRNWVPTSLYLAGVMVLVIRKDRLALRSIGVLAMLILTFAVAQSFPWESVGLAFVNKISHYYMLISITTLFVPVAAGALAGLDASRLIRQGFLRPEIVIIAMGLSIATWNKFVNFGDWLWFGGQGNLIGYETLNNPQWNPDKNYRVITLFEAPPPNVVSGFYDFDSFDGMTNLGSAAWEKYWFEIMRRDTSHVLGTRAGVKWPLWNGEVYDIESHIRTDLLKIAGVRYIFSALPLSGKDMVLVSASKKEDWAKVRPQFFDGFAAFARYRLKRIFDPGKLYVYELPDALPRVFGAKGVNAMIDESTLYSQVAAAPARTIIVQERFMKDLSGPGNLQVTSFQKVRDGFDVATDAPKGGVLVLNQTFSPFWQAWAGDQPLGIVPADGIHMAVAVPAGTPQITVRYRRPLLREFILR
ncbi:MAG: hypothetical protein A3G18_09350 [Rhodospirillales bacterium RIFCSPLOWO2_12_FULL_58_28]|nr:MAG: hypothetical protein A3H92_02320 [Rhodospirillales bacterium RIFCSPLOWO2_02_FULL_58_16]OHC76710.1 MAG: hypothetical protein A3G18_09350 [Rhodospirillales bacterium RIFCSPLOWO2_12_FULL_58_28]